MFALCPLWLGSVPSVAINLPDECITIGSDRSRLRRFRSFVTEVTEGEQEVTEKRHCSVTSGWISVPCVEICSFGCGNRAAL